jgi:hypothetical protein
LRNEKKKRERKRDGQHLKYEEKVWKIEEIRRAPRMRNFVLLIENEDEEDCLRTDRVFGKSGHRLTP